MTDAKTATTPDVPDPVPAELLGHAPAAVLRAFAALCDEGATRRPANRRLELFPFTSQVLRNVASLARKYADAAEEQGGSQPAATDPPVPEQRSADAPAGFSSPLEVTDIDDDPEPSEELPVGSVVMVGGIEFTKIARDPFGNDPAGFTSPYQELDPNLEDDDEPGASLEEAPKHAHAPVVLAPGEPAASGHYAPGTAGYVDPKASS